MKYMTLKMLWKVLLRDRKAYYIIFSEKAQNNYSVYNIMLPILKNHRKSQKEVC